MPKMGKHTSHVGNATCLAKFEQEQMPRLDSDGSTENIVDERQVW
jgi:hypothetical protein